MKNVFLVILFIILSACKSQNPYSDYDYSYSRSGGYAPIYENLLIKGNKVHYSFEGHGKDFKKDFSISDEQLKNIETALSQNNFRTIQEDYKKVYDNISTTISIKKGEQSGNKSDASFIMEKDKARWMNITEVFQQLIASNVNPTAEK